MPALASASGSQTQTIEIELRRYHPRGCEAIRKGLENMLNQRDFLPGVRWPGDVSCESTKNAGRGKMKVRYTLSLPEEGTATKTSFLRYKQDLGTVKDPSFLPYDVVDFFNNIIDRFAHDKDHRFCYYYSTLGPTSHRSKYVLLCE